MAVKMAVRPKIRTVSRSRRASNCSSDKVKYLSGWRDLNSRPLDPQSSALPSCATARWPCSTSISHERELYYEDASGQQRSLLRHNRPRGPLGMPELRAGIRVC